MSLQNKTLYYWSLQLIFWSLLSGLMAITYWVGGNVLEMKMWQIIMDFSIITLLAIFCTHRLKKALNRYVEFDDLEVLDLLKVLGLLALASVLFFGAFTLYLRFAYTFIYDRGDVFNHPTQSLLNNIVVFFNYGIYFSIWTVFYVAIKGLMELNKSRETRLVLETHLKASQLNTLKGQINPHFMFNSLNNIRGLMLEDVNKSRDMLTRLSETLRYSLTKNDVNSIALEDELEMVENYVEISKIQLEDRLKFESSIDPETLSIQIPPMIIQMLVENAIKHGISKIKQGGKVALTTRCENNELEIKVTNSGLLQPRANTTQVGIENIKKRITLLYGEKGVFSLKEIDNQVVATIKIPLT